MKLRELRGAIRKSKGNPIITIELAQGVPLTLALQKTALIDELARAYGDEATVETGLSFNPDTCVLSGPGSASAEVAQATFDLDDDPPSEDDEDML